MKQISWPLYGLRSGLASFLLICLLLFAFQAFAQDSLSRHNDEFDASTSFSVWKQFHEVEKFPSMYKRLEVNAPAGLLHIEPTTSGWYADFHAPFMFKEITGDFDVRARLMVRGVAGESPLSTWSLGGIMIREPKKTDSQSWQPRSENWMFITTGVAEPLNVPVFEVKTTTNSGSNLKLRPAKTGWMEMRVVRLGGTFLMLYRYDGEKKWTLLERFYRPRAPKTLQVGLNAYTDFYSAGDLLKDPAQFNATVVTNGNPDMVMLIDYVRFKTPSLPESFREKFANASDLPYDSPENRLTDFDISNAEILRLIGD